MDVEHDRHVGDLFQGTDKPARFVVDVEDIYISVQSHRVDALLDIGVMQKGLVLRGEARGFAGYQVYFMAKLDQRQRDFVHANTGVTGDHDDFHRTTVGPK